MTLTLKFDLLFKNFTLGHNLWAVRTWRNRVFVLQMCIPCDKTFPLHTIILASQDECLGAYVTTSASASALAVWTKILTLAIRLYLSNQKRLHFYIAHVYSLWQDLSGGIKKSYLVTLTLKIDLLLKNFNLGHNFQTRRGRAFILHMCIPCDETFHMVHVP